MTTAEGNAAGRWRNYPWQVEMQDAPLEPQVEETVIIGPSQGGKTQPVNNIIASYIIDDPSSILVYHPTREMAKTFALQKFSPMVQNTPALKDLIGDLLVKKSRNTIQHKEFPGGRITIAGANSPVSVRQVSARILVVDDSAAFKLTKEGDSRELAVQRTKSFWNRKIFFVTSPTFEWEYTWKEYEKSDGRKYHVPCPHCGVFQELVWENVKFTRNKFEEIERAWYECNACKKEITDRQRWKIVKHGQWVKTNPLVKGIIGFHFSDLYTKSGGFLWCVQQFFKLSRQVFFNTILALPMKEEIEEKKSADYQTEPYELPNADCYILTCFVDVQKNRLELLPVAWGYNEECWLLTLSQEARVINGSPLRTDTWTKAMEYLQTPIEYENGFKKRFDAIGIDSGYKPEMVYPIVKRLQDRGIPSFALKGYGNQRGSDIIHRQWTHKKFRSRVVIVNSDRAKDMLNDRLEIKLQNHEARAEGAIHFNQNSDPDFMAGFFSEKRVPKYINGRLVGYSWRKKNESAPNEPWDLAVGNYALLRLLSPINWDRLRKEFAKKMEKYNAASKEEKAQITSRKPKPRRAPRRDPYTQGYKP